MRSVSSGPDKKRRSALRKPPPSNKLAPTTKPSIFNCFLGEAQSTKKSVVQTNLLGNNCFCLKQNCSGIVHVIEMDRVVTSPCFDFPLYSLETRRLVKCNKCFYVNSLHAHKLNSHGKGLPGVLRLDRATNATTATATETIADTAADATNNEDTDGCADSAFAVRPALGFLRGKEAAKSEQSKPQGGFISTHSSQSSGILNLEDENKTKQSNASKKSVGNKSEKKVEEILDVKEELRKFEAEGGLKAVQAMDDYVAEIAQRIASPSHEHTEAFRQNEAAHSNPDARDWWSRDFTPRHQNSVQGQSNKSGMQSDDKNGSKKQYELIAQLIQKIQQDGTHDEEAVQLAKLVEQLQSKEGWNTPGKEPPVNKNNGVNHPEPEVNSMWQPPEWLFVKKKEEGDGTEVSALHSYDKRFFDSPQTPTPKTRKEQLPPDPSQVPTDAPEAHSIHNAPSNLINYIARTKKVEAKTRDPPQFERDPAAGNRDPSNSAFPYDPPMHDSYYPESHYRQEPGGTKAKDKDPRGRRRRKCPSLSSRLTNPNRRVDHRKSELSTHRERDEAREYEYARAPAMDDREPSKNRRYEGSRQMDAPAQDFKSRQGPNSPPQVGRHYVRKAPDSDREAWGRQGAPLADPDEQNYTSRTPTKGGRYHNRRVPSSDDRRSRALSSPEYEPASDPYEENYPVSVSSPTISVLGSSSEGQEYEVQRYETPKTNRTRGRETSKSHRSGYLHSDVPQSIQTVTSKKNTAAFSLPAVDIDHTLARAPLPSHDQTDKTIDDIIKETVTVMKSTIPRDATTIPPVIPDLPKRSKIRVRKAERRRPEVPLVNVKQEVMPMGYFPQITIPRLDG